MFNVKFRQHTLRLPIIQGGMGVGVSLSKLASAVINEGCMGVISAAQPGFNEEDFYTNNFTANVRALKSEITKTRNNTDHQGLLGVNVMVAARKYKEYIKEISAMDIDVIISGAGLPTELPDLVVNKNIMLAPIVSSAKAAHLICKTWDMRYNKIPDFIVIEGAEAGGHLGFKIDDLLADNTQSLAEILADVLAVIQPYQDKYQYQIPVFVAGGIVSGYDIAKYLKLGASGVQMATSFIATEECDVDIKFKEAVLKCTKDDIAFTKSPSKLHGRALKTNFMKEVNQRQENIKIDRCVACLATCDPSSTSYCITQALIDAARGHTDDGIVFVGSSAAQLSKMTTVKELVQKLEIELRSCYE
ncbi:MAG: nitronate monooxygenase family protein [Erysipelotrichaceae bacterium]|nr:nitronate monooxygenase family protein [Erysipelotrichaceae bacterium]